jgi:Predicted membrane protein
MTGTVNADGHIICPRCGGDNPSDAIFCGNPDCRKALGEFKYSAEEIDRESRLHEKVADRVSSFIGNPYFIVLHAVWFVLWVAVNTGLITMSAKFDEYPFGLLGIILSVEAIFITGFLLISQNRQSSFADKRSELDYEVNVRTFREIQNVRGLLESMQQRIDDIEESLRKR